MYGNNGKHTPGKAVIRPFSAVVLLLLLLSGPLVYGGPEQYLRSDTVPLKYDFKENAEIRARLTALFDADPAAISRIPSKVYEQASEDHRVLVRSEEQAGAVYLLFLNEYMYQFPVYSQGSYIVKKDARSGGFVQVKIFLRNDPDCFLRARPDGSRTKIDLYLFGKPLYLDMHVPIQFSSILTQPLSALVSAAGNKVRWDLVFSRGNIGADREIAGVVETVRRQLPLLGDADDGAMNKEGEYVFIENLMPQGREGEEMGFNCSGFAKWVADGFYLPRTGRMISIDAAKKRLEDSRGNRWSERYEFERDPYFGLDWTRNLAGIIHRSVWTGSVIAAEDLDVRDVPFFRYVKDIGYEISDLHSLMFILAQEEPGYFYFGSVNDVMDDEPYLRRHFHVAVFFPYFDALGKFHTAVFERNVESPLEKFIRGNAGRSIHLVRVPVLNKFLPPAVE